MVRDIQDCTHVSFNIGSYEISARQMTTELELNQTGGFEKGDIFVSSSSNQSVVKDGSLWRFESDHFLQSSKMGEHIRYIYDLFIGKKSLYNHIFCKIVM